MHQVSGRQACIHDDRFEAAGRQREDQSRELLFERVQSREKMPPTWSEAYTGKQVLPPNSSDL